MAEILTESFCERCGTRYTFEAAASRRRAFGRIRTLSRGVKNFVANDDALFSDAMAAAREEDARGASMQQLDAFHRTFNFCMSCRQYTCRNCWNAGVGECLSCAPDLSLEVLPAPFTDLAPVDLDAVAGDAALAPADFVAPAWPMADRRSIVEPAPEPGAVEAEPIGPSEIELTASELAAIEGALSRHVHRYEPAVGPEPAERRRGRRRPLARGRHGGSFRASRDRGSPSGGRARSPRGSADRGRSGCRPRTSRRGPAAEAVPEILAASEPEAVEPVAVEPFLDATAPQVPSAPADDGRTETRRLLQRFRPGHAKRAAAAPPSPAIELAAQAQAPAAAPATTDGATPEPEEAAPTQVVPAPEPALEAAVAMVEPAEAVVAAAEATIAAPVAADELAEVVTAATAEPESIVAAAEPAIEAPAQPAAAEAPGPPELAPAPPVDVAVQPTWRMVAPDGSPEDESEPALPAWATQARTGRRPADAMPAAAWAARVATARPVESPVWEASSRDILAAPTPGAAAPGIHSCVSCGLSLSANARFCRRCGSRQG